MSLHEQERSRAFGQQAVTHADALYNLALWMARDPVEAEDLVQEAYLKALRFSHQFQEGTNLKAWLLKIVKNSYINRYRKRRSEMLSPFRGERDGVEPPHGPAGQEDLIQGDGELGALRSVVRSDIDKAWPSCQRSSGSQSSFQIWKGCPMVK